MTSELRRVYTAIDTRDRIVEAALSVFADVGFAGATMRTIADAAEVSPGLIHHHFKDKETLWKLVGERISSEFLKAISEGVETDNPGESVRQMMANYRKYWTEHPRALRFQLWRVLGAPVEERKARSQMLNQYFVPKIKKAQDAGIVRNDVPAGLAMVTIGALIQYFLHSKIETDDAIAVTGDAPLNDEQSLDYLLGLISPAHSAGRSDTQ